MSFWRKKQIADEVAKDVAPVVEEPKDEFDAEDSIYTVGKNRAGNTQLKIKQNYGYSTLTMSPDAVVDLIKILAITIEGQYKVTIDTVEA